MLIDIPVFISFNADNARQAADSRAGSVFGTTFTLRFDPEDTDVIAMWSPSYPPQAGSRFSPGAEFLWEIYPNGADAKILALANASPEDYFVDQSAAVRLSDEQQQERDPKQ